MVNLSQPQRTVSASAIQSQLSSAIDLVLTENQQVLNSIDSGAIAQLIQALLTTKRIFVEGEGHSGFAIRMAALRLMHLGLQDYVVGETTTPSIQSSNLLIACSGSGSTANVSAIATKAKEVGAQLVVVTTQVNSPLGKIADISIQLNAAAKQDTRDCFKT